MNRDEWIKAYRENSASWPALVGVYAIIIAAMLLSANAII